MEGAGATAQDKGRGYYYGGWLSSRSVPGYQSSTPLKNMLVYDMVTNSFRNQTGPDDTPRAEGVMLYLPVGDGGILVYFGGIQFPYGNETAAAVSLYSVQYSLKMLTSIAPHDCKLLSCRLGLLTQTTRRTFIYTISQTMSGTKKLRMVTKSLGTAGGSAQE
jgi:hypothetical protein